MCSPEKKMVSEIWTEQSGFNVQAGKTLLSWKSMYVNRESIDEIGQRSLTRKQMFTKMNL